MSEVAIVRDTSQQQRSWGRLDGIPAVRIQIRKQPEANTVEVARWRARAAGSAPDQLVRPKDIKYVVDVRPVRLHPRLDQLGEGGALIGAFLASLVVLLFLRRCARR
jgi:multidrug efflux pump subunit AcrB